MASQEHLKLVGEIKKVHLWLRRRSQEVGAALAWKEHLERKEVLQNYAHAMKKLSMDHWAQNNQGDRKNYCRLEWVHRTIQEYYFLGGREKAVLKEIRRLKIENILDGNKPNKLRLLDVGSCFNPFKKFSTFETYAVDLCPASSDVKQCNFLEVQVTRNLKEQWYLDSVSQIPCDFFDVVVFSLFLEYLPSPPQRLKACQLAWNLLKPNGVLAIVTPDSNHQSAHSRLMKSWKLALAQIGLIRFQIEKLKYLYCMAFRKTMYIENYNTLPEYQVSGNPEIHIPQDFVKYDLIRNNDSPPVTDPCVFAEGFAVLPGDDLFV